jgi:Iodothyronine deiodinase
VIYIEEAHPIDGWEMPVNVKDHVLLASAKNLDDRDGAARTCVVKLCITIPALVDDMHDTTEAAYTGWPDRLYVIDTNGRIAYKSGPGPYGFMPDGVDKTLQHLVPSDHSSPRASRVEERPNAGHARDRRAQSSAASLT